MVMWVVSLLFTATTVSAASNMIFKKIDVEMGAVGSDDNIRIKICDSDKCCTTKKLSHLLSSEWKANKLETWDGSDLGDCSSILFNENLSSIEVSIVKALSKKDPLEVTAMVLSAQVGSDKKNIQKFKCGSYKFSKTDASKSNVCPNEKSAPRTTKKPASPVPTKRPAAPLSSGGLPNLQIRKINVQVGATGTDDDVNMQICDLQKCCTTKDLSHTLSSEWVKNKLETWDGRKLGNCSDILFNSGATSLEVSVIKSIKKKQPLDITSIILEASTSSDKKKIQKFKCGTFKFGGTDAKKTNFCLSDNSANTAAKTTKKPAAPVTTKRPSAALSSGGLPNLQVKKINVQVGPTGTDDDVTMQICDLKKCCTTSELSHTLSSEWVKNKLETWDGRKLGNCSNILFTSGASSLEVSVFKTIKKKKPLEITSIVLEASPTNDKKKIEKFNCGNYKFGATDTKKVNFCLNSNSASLTKTTPRSITSLADLENYKVNNVVVQMGDDGTNDDVSLEICNSKSALTCCETGKLSGLLSNDWSKNDKETWKNKDLGPCKTKNWDACRGFDVAVKKKSGKDSLKIKDITLELVDKKDAKKTQKFLCSNYTFGASDTIKRSSCVLEKGSSLSCPKTPVTTKRTTKRPGPPSPTRKSSLPTPSKSALSSGTENVIIKGFQVTVGRDGTKDIVKAKVCTPDQKLCCETLELKARTGNNWVRNGNTTWKGAPLGLCRDMQFPTKSRTTITNLLETKLIVTLNKTGKDGMKLDKFTLEAETSSGALPRRFKCGKINVLDSNKAQKECYAQFPKKSSATATKKAKTTTRPPFRSGSG